MKSGKEQTFVSVVAYMHNDETIVGSFLRKVDEFMYKTFEAYEIILVNDASTDNSLEKARETIKHDVKGNIVILNLSRKHNIEKAMLAGLDKSVGDFVFEIDSLAIDYPVEMLYELYQQSSQGYDIVTASPDKSHTASRLFYSLVNRMSYLKLDLSTETVKIVSRRALNAMLNLKEKVRYRKALYAYTGYATKKVKYQAQRDMHHHVKKVTGENIALALDVIVSFSNFGLKLAHYLSIGFFLFSLFMIFYSIYNYLFNNHVVEGWTTLMIVTSTGFAGMFFIMAMLGEYMARILIEVQNRPYYTVRSVEIYKEKEQEVS